MLYLCPVFSCLHEAYPHGIYITMETLHSHVKVKSQCKGRLRTVMSMYVVRGQRKYGRECVNLTLCWRSSETGATDKGQTHQLQEIEIYVGLIDSL